MVNVEWRREEERKACDVPEREEEKLRILKINYNNCSGVNNRQQYYNLFTAREREGKLEYGARLRDWSWTIKARMLVNAAIEMSGKSWRNFRVETKAAELGMGGGDNQFFVSFGSFFAVRSPFPQPREVATFRFLGSFLPNLLFPFNLIEHGGAIPW